MLGHFPNPHLASHSMFAAHIALIKPTRSHTCSAAWLEFAQCQADQPLRELRHILQLYCSWCEKASYPLLSACNDVLRLGQCMVMGILPYVTVCADYCETTSL